MLPPALLHTAWIIPVAVGAARSAAALLTRKRLAWRTDLDMPVGLVPEEQHGANDEMTTKIIFPRPGRSCPAGANDAWLVLLTVANTGLAPIRDEDFSAPLTFAFPGRQVCGVQMCSNSRARRAEMIPAAPAESSRSPACIQLSGQFLLNRNDQFTLMVILTGAPASPVQLHGSLPGGRITTGARDGQVSAARR